MYRQIPVDPRDIGYQQVVWRNSHQEPIQSFALKTVTYGTASASFLAKRTLKQLTIDEGEFFPLASSIVNNSTYVDVISDTAELERVKRAVAELRLLLPKGGFELKKWSSNSQELMDSIPLELHKTPSNRIFGDTDDASVKTLGLFWQPSNDLFSIECI